MNAEDFQALKSVFIAETEEFLQVLEQNLLAMEEEITSQQRLELVKEMFRSAHSMKGSALMFGFENFSKAAHRLEDGFAILRDKADLSAMNHEVVTTILSGVDRLRNMLAQINSQETDENREEDMQAIGQIKTYLESHYGKLEKPKQSVLQQSSNPATLKIIFERDLPPVFERLEAELSQANADSLGKTCEAINKIYFQLSGVAGMLQLPEFAEIAESLQLLLESPGIPIEEFQANGWAIAQNLRTAQQQIVAGQPIKVEAISPTDHSEDSETLATRSEAHPVTEIDKNQTRETTKPEIAEIEIDSSPPTPESGVSTGVLPLQSSAQRPTIRVDLESLTELVNLVGELVINRTNLERQETLLRGEVKRLRRSIFELNQSGSQLREDYDHLSVRRSPVVPSTNINSRINFSINYGNGSSVGAVPPCPPPCPPPSQRQFGGIADSWIPQNGQTHSGYQSGYHRKNKYKSQKNNHFDPLELDEFSEFHTTAQRVIETSQVIANSAEKIEDLSGEFEGSIDQLRRVTNSLRSRIMQLRVVPFSNVVDRLPRFVRELCRTQNKEVNLLLLGRDTKIDESLLDALRDPLVHLVRNAFDHGIESAELRKAAGKPASGQIEIEACHQGGQTIITVSDDGRGIDPEIIRQKVIERGFLNQEQASELSMAELYDFLFWPGFSTTNQVTDLSGRGVGLDVVRMNLRQVRGTVKVDSRLGQGTSFIIKLPLLLSITDALLVNLDNHILAIPLDAVEEIIKLQPEDIHMAGDRPIICWRDEFIRLVRLADLLSYNSHYPDQISPKREQDFIPVLILNSSEGILAVIVDYLAGQQEIVVKALPAPLSKPKGVIGNTILGDGRVVTIVDVDDLIEHFHPHTHGAVAIPDHDSPKLAHSPYQAAKILVVDDSYTLRQLVALSLSRARYRVAQAKDGLDAIHQLERGLDCDLIIADIEMPRMDGFDLLRSLKYNPNWAKIPVVMLTSRSGPKHRHLAQELGAYDYFTKPYNEAKFLTEIAKILENR
jgi:chemotaxis family two-component system sensor histidine kinase/response regulator PixL